VDPEVQAVEVQAAVVVAAVVVANLPAPDPRQQASSSASQMARPWRTSPLMLGWGMSLEQSLPGPSMDRQEAPRRSHLMIAASSPDRAIPQALSRHLQEGPQRLPPLRILTVSRRDEKRGASFQSVLHGLIALLVFSSLDHSHPGEACCSLRQGDGEGAGAG
jgi:hypothetical protein